MDGTRLRRFRIAALLLVTATTSLAVSSSLHAAAPSPRLAVMPLAGHGVEKRITATLTDLITVAVAETEGFDVIGADEIQALLGLERMKDALGCDDVSCMAEIGGAIGSDFMVTGNAGRLGEGILLKLTLFDAKRLHVIRRTGQTLSSDENTYAQATRLALSKIFPELRFDVTSAAVAQPATAKGVLFVDTTPPGAKLTVDGKLLGFSPLQTGLAAGSHTLHTTLPGFIATEQVVEITVDDALRVSLELKEEPMPPKVKWGHISFWPGLFVAAVAGGATAMAQREADRYRTGVPDAGDANHRWSAIALGGYLLGAAGLITGAGLWYFADADASE